MAIYRIKRFSSQEKFFELFKNLSDKTLEKAQEAMKLSNKHYTDQDLPPILDVFKVKEQFFCSLGGFCWKSLDRGNTWKRTGNCWKKTELKTLTLDEFKEDLISQLDYFIKNSEDRVAKNYYTNLKQEILKLNNI